MRYKTLSAVCIFVIALGNMLSVSAQEGEAPAGPDPTTPTLNGSPIIQGDRIRVVLREDPEVTYFGEVTAAGTIPVPYLGEFAIAGMTPTQAEKALEKELKKDLYNQATVAITLVKKALGRVYIYGAVTEPGVVDIPDVGGLTVLQLITHIGGLSRWAAPEDTFIMRRDRMGEPRRRIPVNLDELFESAVPNSEKDIMLQPNDIVCIPGRSGGLFDFLSVEDAEVFVVGEVKNDESIVYFAPGERRTLFRAVLKAGGFSKFAKTNAVRIIRYQAGKKRQEIEVDASAIVEEGEMDEDVALEQGDMIIVPQRRISF
ncbi:MAG: SLBB domain-containing protein [Lentisphaeria bacterium]